jgi:hypothetical protein
MTDDEREVLALIADREPVRLPSLLTSAAERLEELGFALWTNGGWCATREGQVALRSAKQTKH